MTVTTAPSPAPAGAAEGFDSAPFRSAIEQYRSTAKWVIGAFAAVGGLVVGSVPFAALSGVDTTGLGIVIWGAVLALGGVGLAIAAVAVSLVPRSVYPHEVEAKNSWFKRLFSGRWAVNNALHDHPTTLLPVGISKPDQLVSAIRNLELEILRAQNSGYTDQEIERLKDRRRQYDDAYLQLQWLIRFEKGRNVFRLSLATTVAAALIVGLGVALLLRGLDDNKRAADVAKLNAETQQIEANAAKARAEADQARANATKARAEAEKTRAETEQLGSDSEDPDATP